MTISKADKMLEELGYREMQNAYLKKNDDGYTKYILFANGGYFVSLQPTYNTVPINKKEHLAIHEKMKELGWIK